jgi:phage tail sheath protein FI
MPQALLHPGVYIEEVPSGVRTISGVATSVAAFVGYTAQGPVNKAVQIFSFADFERQFGGLHLDSPLSYAVSHFFMNGGGTAWIVRVAAGATKASVEIASNAVTATPTVLLATAVSEGAWGNDLEITVDYATSNPASLFNLNVAEVQSRNGGRQVVRSEAHRNLSMNSFASNYAVDVVRAASNLIRLERPAGLTSPDSGTARSGEITSVELGQLNDNARRLAISLDGGRTHEFDIFDEGGTVPATVGDLATAIETAVQLLEPTNPAFMTFSCVEDPAAAGLLLATSGSGTDERSSVTFFNAGTLNAAGILSLGLSNGGRESAAAAGLRPVQSGTEWIRTAPQPAFTTIDLAAEAAVKLSDSAGDLLTPVTMTLWSSLSNAPTNLEGLRKSIEDALHAESRPEFSGARVLVVDDQIVAIPGGANPGVRLVFTAGPAAGTTDLFATSVANVAAYQLGVGPTSTAQVGATPGSDGSSSLVPADFSGSQSAKTGLYALEDVDLFNILMLPDQSDAGLQAEAVAYARKRRAFVLLDMPSTDDTLPEAKTWITAASTPHDENAAAYFPRIKLADPLRDNRITSFSNVGAIAGLFARTDAERGVWKAPAGTAARLVGVQGLDYTLTDAENGAINPLGLNAIRTFPVYGNIAWGARTTVGADAQASEWKYVPIRRLALFLEESLYRGTQWVVFEPNDEPLWAQIRLNIGAFLNGLFRQGAFQGKTPKEAYFVKCDRETTTQADINLGIVNILVGFAPLKPAEFVVIKIQQLAGQVQA